MEVINVDEEKLIKAEETPIKDDRSVQDDEIRGYDEKLDNLKDTIKKLKKIKKRKEKLRELEREKTQILRNMEKHHK